MADKAYYMVWYTIYYYLLFGLVSVKGKFYWNDVTVCLSPVQVVISKLLSVDVVICNL